MTNFIRLLATVHPMVYVVLSAVLVTTGDYFAKLWSIEHRGSHAVVMTILYALCGVVYLPSLLREGLVVTAVAWSVLSILGFMFVGFVIFKETVAPVQIAGIVLGSMAIILLSLR